MKGVLLIVVLLGIVAASANGATLSMNWVEGDGVLIMAISDTADIELWVDLLPGETFSTLAYANGATPDLSQTGLTPMLPNWSFGGGNGELGTGAQQVAFAADHPFSDSLAGPGSFLIGTQTIHLDTGAVPGVMMPITFDTFNLLFLDQAGAPFTWDARDNETYAGHVAFGDWGNPGWGSDPAKGHQPDPNPLYAMYIPEPGTLALLALGTIGLIAHKR